MVKFTDHVPTAKLLYKVCSKNCHAIYVKFNTLRILKIAATNYLAFWKHFENVMENLVHFFWSDVYLAYKNLEVVLKLIQRLNGEIYLYSCGIENL